MIIKVMPRRIKRLFRSEKIVFEHVWAIVINVLNGAEWQAPKHFLTSFSFESRPLSPSFLICVVKWSQVKDKEKQRLVHDEKGVSKSFPFNEHFPIVDDLIGVDFRTHRRLVVFNDSLSMMKSWSERVEKGIEKQCVSPDDSSFFLVSSLISSGNGRERLNESPGKFIFELFRFLHYPFDRKENP